MRTETLIQESFILKVRHGNTIRLNEEVRKLSLDCSSINGDVLEIICQLLDSGAYLSPDDYVGLVLKVKNRSFYERTRGKMYLEYYPDTLHRLLTSGVPDPNIENIIITSAFKYFQKGRLDLVKSHLQAIIKAGTKHSLPILKVMKFEIAPKYDIAKIKQNVAYGMQKKGWQISLNWADIKQTKLDFRTAYLIDAAIAAVRFTSSDPSPHWVEWTN